MPDTSQQHLPNYRTIAQACGVGKTTVGRVLQGVGYVSANVRQRVLDAAANLGYQPDPSLGALSRRRWPKGAQPHTVTLAWIFRGKKGTPSPQAPEFRGACGRAAELGYTIDSFNLSDYPGAAALSRVIYNRGIRGVLVQALRDGEQINLDWPLFFTIFVGPENDVARVHNVLADFRAAMHQGVTNCLERGYRSIGIALMNYQASGTNVPFRAQALYERERVEFALGPQPPLFEFQPKDPDAVPFRKWVKSHRVDAIVSTHIQPYYFLTSPNGPAHRFKILRVPQDIGFICLREAPELPDLTHMDLREFEQGRQAVDLAHQQLQHGMIGRPEVPLRLLIPPAFVSGNTLPALSRPTRRVTPGENARSSANCKQAFSAGGRG